MDRLPKKISLVAAAAAVAGGPTTVVAQAQRGGGHGNLLTNPHHPHQHQSDDRALRIDGDSNARAAIDTAPEVASIVNGKPTNGTRSFMVALAERGKRGKNDEIFTICGGTLITPTTVLTSAHCMYRYGSFYPPNQVLVNLYDKYDEAGVVTINIQDPSEGADIVLYPDYDDVTDTFENDIALIFLPFAIGQEADYVQINDDPHEPVFHAPLRVMGWGRTEYGGSASDVLLETTVDYVSNEYCQKANADAPWPITDGNMCAYKKDTGFCQGDAGGPLFLEKEHGDGEIGERPTQVGIVSWLKNPCASPGFPQVYTRVSYYAGWIKETVCSRSEHATKELCGSSKSGKSTKSSSHAP